MGQYISRKRRGSAGFRDVEVRTARPISRVPGGGERDTTVPTRSPDRAPEYRSLPLIRHTVRGVAARDRPQPSPRRFGSEVDGPAERTARSAKPRSPESFASGAELAGEAAPGPGRWWCRGEPWSTASSDGMWTRRRPSPSSDRRPHWELRLDCLPVETHAAHAAGAAGARWPGGRDLDDRRLGRGHPTRPHRARRRPVCGRTPRGSWPCGRSSSGCAG